VLENVIALAEPVICTGALGIWTVPPDRAVEVRRRALEAKLGIPNQPPGTFKIQQEKGQMSMFGDPTPTGPKKRGLH
jgi:hypothetical protein